MANAKVDTRTIAVFLVQGYEGRKHTGLHVDNASGIFFFDVTQISWDFPLKLVALCKAGVLRRASPDMVVCQQRSIFPITK